MTGVQTCALPIFVKAEGRSVSRYSRSGFIIKKDKKKQNKRKKEKKKKRGRKRSEYEVKSPE